eukprot:TRINITY_DN980_c0_g1_i1.p1 TRINITY_DN980_c0_g1~~TRINITY_DN980_c0_g1_i1.p1  ORF type:complete len:483 (+),score=99.90 TRINITY_DN980_c0_g1_i1:87-1451(+)
MNTIRRLIREIKDISVRGVFEDQATFTFPNPSNCLIVDAILTPTSGYFQDGKIIFRFNLKEDYPRSAPEVSCLTKIYHPNISFTGRICFNILSSDWQDGLTVEQLTNALLWLLNNPNFNSPLNGAVGAANYARLTREALLGKTVSGTTFALAIASAEKRSQITRELFKDKIFANFNKFKVITSHLDPFVEKLHQMQAEVVEFHPGSHGSIHSRLLLASEKYILKNTVYRIRGTFWLVISLEDEVVSHEALLSLVQRGEGTTLAEAQLDPAPLVSRLQKKELSQYTGFYALSMPSFGHRTIDGHPLRTLVSTNVLEWNKTQDVYMPSGLKDNFIKVLPNQLTEYFTPGTQVVIGAISAKTEFTIHYRTNFGESIYLVGEKEELGSWAVEKAIKMECGSDCVWRAVLPNPKTLGVEYKYCLKKENEPDFILWESRENRKWAGQPSENLHQNDLWSF